MVGTSSARLKVVLGGHIATAQTWSVGINIAVATITDPTQGELDAVRVQLETAAGVWATAIKSYWAADTQYDNISVYHYPSGAIHALRVSKNVVTTVAGNGTPPLPSVASAVQSLRTSVPGRTGRGRLYVPLTAQALGTNHQLTTGQCSGLSNATASMLTAWNALAFANPPFTSHAVCVASFSTAACPPVTRVVVDSVVDIQHRRSDKLLASSVTSSNV